MSAQDLSILVAGARACDLAAKMAPALDGALAGRRFEVVVVPAAHSRARGRFCRQAAKAGDDVEVAGLELWFDRLCGDCIAVLDDWRGDADEAVGAVVRMLAVVDAGADVAVGAPYEEDAVPPSPLERLRALLRGGMGAGHAFMLRRPMAASIPLDRAGWGALVGVLAEGGPAARVAPSRGQVGRLRAALRAAVQDPARRRPYLFALVGASGVVVNMGVFLALTRLGLVAEGAAMLSAVIAMLSNFIGNDRLTYGDRRSGRLRARAVKALMAQGVGVALDTLMVGLMHGGLGAPAALANLTGIATGALWNYSAFSAWVWAPASDVGGRRPGARGVRLRQSARQA